MGFLRCFFSCLCFEILYTLHIGNSNMVKINCKIYYTKVKCLCHKRESWKVIVTQWKMGHQFSHHQSPDELWRKCSFLEVGSQPKPEGILATAFSRSSLKAKRPSKKIRTLFTPNKCGFIGSSLNEYLLYIENRKKKKIWLKAKKKKRFLKASFWWFWALRPNRAYQRVSKSIRQLLV